MDQLAFDLTPTPCAAAPLVLPGLVAMPEQRCAACPTDGASWMRGGGLVQWMVLRADGSHEVTVGARTVQDAVKLVEGRGPGLYVAARRCFSCAGWWGMHSAARLGMVG